MYSTKDLVEAFTELEQAAPTTLLRRPPAAAAEAAPVQFITDDAVFADAAAMGVEAEVLPGGSVAHHLHPPRWAQVMAATAAVAVIGGGAFGLRQHSATPSPQATAPAMATPPFTVHTRTLLPPATSARTQLRHVLPPVEAHIQVEAHMLKEWTGRGPITFALTKLVARNYRAVTVTCTGPGEVIFDDRTRVPCDPATHIVDPLTSQTAVQTVKIQADSRTSWRVRFYDHDPTVSVSSAAVPQQHPTTTR